MVKKNEESFYDGEDELFDQDPSKQRKTGRWVGAVLITALIGGGAAATATQAYMSNKAKHEVNNAENEGLLRSRGFDENNIVIEISGQTDTLTVSCPGVIVDSALEDDKHVSYIYDDQTMTASWDVAPQLDESGQIVDTFPSILFPLKDKEDVEGFINHDLVQACDAVSSN